MTDEDVKSVIADTSISWEMLNTVTSYCRELPG